MNAPAIGQNVSINDGGYVDLNAKKPVERNELEDFVMALWNNFVELFVMLYVAISNIEMPSFSNNSDSNKQDLLPETSIRTDQLPPTHPSHNERFIGAMDNSAPFTISDKISLRVPPQLPVF